VNLLLQNTDKIDWDLLSTNSNDRALDCLLANPEKINWALLSLNTNTRVIEILKQNQDKINWCNLSRNPWIFEEDYQSLSKERSDLLREELMEKTWHPKRFRHWCLDTDDEFHL
jgi:hypothetical protein